MAITNTIEVRLLGELWEPCEIRSAQTFTFPDTDEGMKRAEIEAYVHSHSGDFSSVTAMEITRTTIATHEVARPYTYESAEGHVRRTEWATVQLVEVLSAFTEAEDNEYCKAVWGEFNE